MDLIPAGDLVAVFSPWMASTATLALSSGLYRLRFILPSAALAVTP
jgi:hypothetical protein